MQADGNLVLYGTGSGHLWASNTRGGGDTSYFILQDDGNAVVYHTAPLWDSESDERRIKD